MISETWTQFVLRTVFRLCLIVLYFEVVIYYVIFQVPILLISTSSWALPQYLWLLPWSALPTWAGNIAIEWANTAPAPAARTGRSATSTTSTERMQEAGTERGNMEMVIKFMFPTRTLSTSLMTMSRPTWTIGSEIRTQPMVAIKREHRVAQIMAAWQPDCEKMEREWGNGMRFTLYIS